MRERTMPPARRIAVVATLGIGLLLAQAASAGIEIYEELRDCRPSGRRVQVANFVMERDVFRFEFTGVFEFLAPVAGHIPGAIFEGEGRFILNPATVDERRHLALVTGNKSVDGLSDSFERLVLLFSDQSAEEIKNAGQPGGASAGDRALEVLHDFGNPRKDIATRLHIRLLQDLLAEPRPSEGVFMALFRGKNTPRAVAIVDPLGVEAMFIASGLGGEEVAFYVDDRYDGGFWYLEHRQEEIRSRSDRSCRPRLSFDAKHYDITTTLDKDDRLSATTTIRIEAVRPGLRVIPAWLTTRLRVERAALVGNLGKEREIPFVQESLEAKVDHLADGVAAVILPEALEKGEMATISFRYAGEHVLVDAGEGNYYVRARSSWYPNTRKFGDRATYRLAYHLPPKMEVISVGDRVEDLQTEDMNISLWESDEAILVAGFNYGKFEKIEHVEKNSGLKLAVYTNPGTPDVINEANFNKNFSNTRAPGTIELPIFEGDIRINTADLAESAMADAINSAMFFSAAFGSIPQKQLAITQQSQWSFGQSWPSLIFLPYLAFVDSVNRAGRSSQFVEQVGPHEIAHQWWGHLVGWESYRDQWLSEGFAEFSTAFLLQQTHGWEAYDGFWENRRERLLARNRGGLGRNFEVGPISRGWRLSTSKSEYAYPPIVYGKGGFVLHMLRMMMFDEKTKVPDARFIAMLRDYVKSYTGKSASTEDFKAVVERHMIPSMNATGDGKMDWFFDQWVHGTEIPRYTVDVSIKKAGRGSYRLNGKISQEDVSESFRAIVPIYIEYKNGESVMIGRTRFSGPMSQKLDVTLDLPKKPRRVIVNAHHEVLALD